MQGHNESRPDCSRFYQSSLVNLQEWRLQNLSSGLSAPLLNYPYTFFLPYIQSDPPISIYVCCLSSYHAPLTPSPRQPPCQPCQPAVRAPKAISSPGWTSPAPSPLLTKQVLQTQPSWGPSLQFINVFLELRKLDSTLSFHMEALSLPFSHFETSGNLRASGYGLRPILLVRDEAQLFTVI